MGCAQVEEKDPTQWAHKGPLITNVFNEIFYLKRIVAVDKVVSEGDKIVFDLP